MRHTFARPVPRWRQEHAVYTQRAYRSQERVFGVELLVSIAQNQRIATGARRLFRTARQQQKERVRDVGDDQY